MKLFGSIGELVSLVFRLAGGKEVKVTSAAQTGGSVTPAVPVEIEIPDVGAGGSDVFVTEGAVQTLTNKTIDANGTGNSITNLEEADFQTKLADANKVLTRNASGAVTSAAITNANVDAAAAIAESKLALSYSTSSLNSALDTKLDDFASTNDSRVVLTSGTSGNAVKESAVTINGLGELSGATRLDVDNVRTDGNTISSTNANGPLTIEAAGTATVRGVGGDVILDATDDAIQLIGANVMLRDGASLSLFDDSDANSVLITVPTALSQDRFPQIPDAAGNFVLEQGSQILYNKTISGNNNTLTVLAASQLSGAVPVANGGTGQTSQTAAFDALAPTTTQGDTIYHNGTDNVRLAKGSAGQVLTMNSGATAPEWADAGGGSGEKNYVENPSASSSITGWVNVGDLDVARTTTVTELPREYTTGSGIKITADTNPQSAADYVYYDFTLDDVDLNKKLKIEWAQKVIGGYVDGTLEVVITTQADRTTALHTPDVSAIPSYDGVFQASFDSANTAALSLVIRGTSTDMATGAGIVISDVIVGPGSILAVPAVGTWQTFTPSWVNITVGNGVSAGRYQRVGDSMMLEANLTFGTTTAVSGNISLTIPNALNAVLQATNYLQAGVASAYDASNVAARQTGSAVVSGSTTSILFSYSGTGSGTWSTSVPFTWASGDAIAVKAIIPIAEWAGAPNYAGSNDVEYASVGGTWDASSSTTVYGPAGSQMGGALSAARTKTVTFITPIQATDFIQVQMSRDGVVWTPIVGSVTTGGRAVSTMYNNAGSLIGVGYEKTSSTTLSVYFGRYVAIENDDGAAYDWGTDYWRVVKFRAGAVVGFGLATDTRAGLVSTGTQSFAGDKTFLGPIKIGNGTASAPSLEFSSDSDGSGTGLYRVGANSLGFAANGVNVGQYTSGGLWRLGPAAGVSGTMQTTSDVFLVGGDDLHSGGSYLCIGRRSSATKTAYLVAGGGSECGLTFAYRDTAGSTQTAGSYDSSGAWTIGTGTGQIHRINCTTNATGTSATPVNYMRLNVNGTVYKVALLTNT